MFGRSHLLTPEKSPSMETVSVGREFDASENRVRSVLGDVTALFETAGFDVERDDDHLQLSKRVAVTQFELTVKLDEEEPAALAYDQVSGPFEEMATRYRVDSNATASHLAIETSFEPPAVGFGSFLNGAAVKRQRRAELDAVASLLESDDEPSERVTDGRTIGAGGD